MIPAASKADRRTVALVVVDIQQRLAAAMDRRDQVVDRAVLLIRTAEILGIPVVATRQHPKGLGEFESPVAEALERARGAGVSVTIIDKLAFDCFAEQRFCDAVVATGMRQLVVAGMESHICVAQTALSGLREGYDVHVAADGCCSRLAEHHELALARLGGAGAVITTSESVAYELVERAGTEEFKRLLVAVKELGSPSGR